MNKILAFLFQRLPSFWEWGGGCTDVISLLSCLLSFNRNLSNNKISLLRNGSFYGLAALEKL